MATMTTEKPATPGQTLAARMRQLGINKTQLSQASQKSRGTINKALADNPRSRPATYADLMRVLDGLEGDLADGTLKWAPSDAADLVRIEMRGVFGVEAVTFSGPPEDVEAVRQAAVDFVRQVREGADRDSGGDVTDQSSD